MNRLRLQPLIMEMNCFSLPVESVVGSDALVACRCERRKSILANLFKLQSFTLQHDKQKLGQCLRRLDENGLKVRLDLNRYRSRHTRKKSTNNVAYHLEHVTTGGGKVEAKWMQIYSPNAESDRDPSLRRCGRKWIELKREEETDSALSPFNEKAQSNGKSVRL